MTYPHRILKSRYFYTRPLGELSLKGRAEPVRASDVISARVARTRLDVEAERGLTPFVGRQHGMRLLGECFERAKAGHGQVVFIDPRDPARLAVLLERVLTDETLATAPGRRGHDVAREYDLARVVEAEIDLLKRVARA